MSVERITNAYSRTNGHNINFSDAELPAGTQNGSNQTFTLAYIPQVNSLRLYLNGTFLVPNVDYTIASLTITIDVASTPGSSDNLTAFYRF